MNNGIAKNKAARKFSRRILEISVFAGALAGLAAPAMAATAQGSDSGLEEIVVTARKTAENLQNTPISITAFTAARLEAQGITKVSRIQDFTPNLTFANIPANSGIASNAAVYIRGIGQNDFSPTVDPGVGMYIDGVYLGRTVGGVFDLIDVSSVEVLRGPQGTLFGRNTIGGAINITTIQPSEKLVAKADVKYGTGNRINVRGLLSGPLAQGVYGKISGGIFSQDGYVNAPALGKKLGNQDTKTLKGALRIAPVGAPYEVTFAGDYSRDKSNGAPVVITGIDPNAGGSFVTLNNFIASGLTNPGVCYEPANANNTACYNSRLFSRDTNYSTAQTFSNLQIWSASMTASWNVTDDIKLKSITAYRHIDGKFAQDRDGSNLEINQVYDIFTQKQFSQEFQFTGKALNDRLKWVTGLYYYTEKGEEINPIDFLVVKAQSGGYYNYKDWAAFAQLSYNLTDKLVLTAGARYTQDRKKYLPDQYVASTLAPFLVIPPGTRIVPYQTVEANTNKWTPMVNLSYQATNALMVYASYSQGFKGGGYTQRIFPPEASLPSFQPETADTYEAGFKFMGLDNRFRLNGAAFYTDYKNMQLLVSDASRVGPYITNAGKARIQGFELETSLLPAAGWRLNAAVGMTDAAFKQLANNVQGLNLDSKFVYVSKWTVSASIEKSISLADLGEITPRVDWSYRSGFFTNANGINDPNLYQPGYSVFNGNIRWTDKNAIYSLTAGVDNIGNNKFRTFGDYQPSFGFYMQSFDRGRQYYVRAGFSF